MLPQPLTFAASIAIGFVPMVGDMYDAVAVITGVDPFTGERLTSFERSLAVVAAILPFITVGTVRALVRNSEHLTFYHGTNSVNAAKIRGGIDLSFGRGGLDFDPVGGKGFYVTKDYQQAVEWSELLVEQKGGLAEILTFSVSKSRLARLDGKVFLSADEEWAKFVIAGRNETLHHMYDYVEGPMLRKRSLPNVNLEQGILPLSKGHQLAIYTFNAVKLFQESLLQ